MDIDRTQVRRAWVASGAKVLEFCLETSLPPGDLDPMVLADAGRAATESANRRPGGRPTTAEAVGWVQTMSGWSALLLGAFDLDEAFDWLDEFVEAFAGVGGVVTAARSHSTLPAMRLSVAPIGLMVLSAPEIVHARRPDRITRWWASSSDLTERTTDWVGLTRARHFLQSGGYVVNYKELANFDCAPAVEASVRAGFGTSFYSIRGAPFEGRAATWHLPAYASLYDWPADGSWRQAVGAITEFLVNNAEHVELGMVRLSRGDGWDNSGGQDRWPSVDNAAVVSDSQPFFSSWLPDVSGVQLVTEAHLDRIGVGTDWQVEKVAPDRFLMSSRDPEAWFGRDRVNPDVLAGARNMFRNCILNNEVIEVSSPWPDGRYSEGRWRRA